MAYACILSGDASGDEDALGSGSDVDDDDEELTEVNMEDHCVDVYRARPHHSGDPQQGGRSPSLRSHNVCRSVSPDSYLYTRVCFEYPENVPLSVYRTLVHTP